MRHRTFLGAAGGGLDALVGAWLGASTALPVIPQRPEANAEDALCWTLTVPRTEMGQDIATAPKRIACAELGVGWDAVAPLRGGGGLGRARDGEEGWGADRARPRGRHLQGTSFAAAVAEVAVARDGRLADRASDGGAPPVPAETLLVAAVLAALAERVTGRAVRLGPENGAPWRQDGR